MIALREVETTEGGRTHTIKADPARDIIELSPEEVIDSTIERFLHRFPKLEGEELRYFRGDERDKQETGFLMDYVMIVQGAYDPRLRALQAENWVANSEIQDKLKVPESTVAVAMGIVMLANPGLVAALHGAQGIYDQGTQLAQPLLDNLNPPSVFAAPDSQTQRACENYNICVPFSYNGVNWKWALHQVMPPDPNLTPYQPGVPAPGIEIFRDNTWVSSFVLPNADPIIGGGRMAIADVLVDTNLGKAVLPTGVEYVGGRYSPRGGYLITNLINPENPANRIRIADQGLPAEISGEREPVRYEMRGSQLYLVRSITDAIPSTESGNRIILADRNGFITGILWSLDQSTPTVTPTATNTRIPESPTPGPSATPSGENMGVRAANMLVSPPELSWQNPINETAFLVLKAANGGPLQTDRVLPADSTMYRDLMPLSGLTVYWVVALNGSQIIDYSDVYAIFPAKAGIVPQGFGIGLRDKVATISLIPSNEDRALIVLGNTSPFIPVERGASRLSYDTRGVSTCFVVVGLQESRATGNTDVACGIPLPRTMVSARN